jgi:hypothetical protein
MNALEEIERASETLPAGQKMELLLYVAGSLRKEQASLPEPRLFSDEQLRAWMQEDEEAMRRFRAGVRIFLDATVVLAACGRQQSSWIDCAEAVD